MRIALALLLLAGCSFPELAMAPDERSGPPPPLAPLPPLVAEEEDALDPEADAAALQVRATALRKRAAAIPGNPIEPETRRAMERLARP